MAEAPWVGSASLPAGPPDDRFAHIEQYRGELRRYCRRVLGSGFETEDAVQETLLRAWRGLDAFEGRSSIRTWLFRIATNVCLGMLTASQRRAAPTSVATAFAFDETDAATLERAAILAERADDRDPASVAVDREAVRLAFVAAVQSLSSRQRAVLILREVLHWRAAEVAELLGASVASVNSSLQRARANLASRRASAVATPAELDEAARVLLAGYLEAFEGHDIGRLVELVRYDASETRGPARRP
jgi:RNA polymerase sigma-70 factor (ECF subfamily)